MYRYHERPQEPNDNALLLFINLLIKLDSSLKIFLNLFCLTVNQILPRIWRGHSGLLWFLWRSIYIWPHVQHKHGAAPCLQRNTHSSHVHQSAHSGRLWSCNLNRSYFRKVMHEGNKDGDFPVFIKLERHYL